MRCALKTRKGFSLIELLTTVVVVTVIGAAAAITVSVLSQSNETARNRTLAQQLLQKSLEEVRRVAQTSFDQLNTCQFPIDNNSPNACGFDLLANEYAGFTRVLNATSQVNGSNELKNVQINVSWAEFGRNNLLSSVTLLSRPPDPLPGNVIGIVSSQGAGNPLVTGAVIRLTRVNATGSYDSISQGNLSAKGVNFDYASSLGGTFGLPTGSYQLTATHPNFENYSHGNLVVISSNNETRVDFAMVPKPVDATISGRLVLRTSGQPIPSFANAAIRLYENGVSQQQLNSVTNYNFTVRFTTPQQRCFTLNTVSSYLAGYAYPVNRGGAPSCTFDYNPQGYSTAVVAANASLNCANPYNGGPANVSGDPDRVCVNPGDNLTINLSLDPVPEVIVQGMVLNSQGQPIANAVVSAFWPASAGGSRWLRTATTDAQGRYSISVPAVQGMFTNGAPNASYLAMYADGLVPITGCCDQPTNVSARSQTLFVGPLFPGDGPRAAPAFTITAGNQTCGNLGGNIRDGSSGSGINAVAVSVASQATSSAAGAYLYSCQSTTGYRIPQGTYAFLATHPSYYPFDSRGNNFYAARPGAVIQANLLRNYDGTLWPRNTGTISGVVRDRQSGLPLSNARVELILYDNSRRTVITGVNGLFSFPAVPETWPPPNLPPNDPSYNRTVRQHSLTVTHSSGIFSNYASGLFTLNAGENKSFTIDLDPLGQF